MAPGAAPDYGLFGGSVSLAGGHGTAIAWRDVAEAAGLVNRLLFFLGLPLLQQG